MLTKPRKKEKVLAPPPQRKDDPGSYYTLYCRTCLGRYWPRSMPSYGGQCAKCWSPALAAQHWDTFWKEVFYQCIHRKQWAVIHKSPTFNALNTLESVAQNHPAVPVAIILGAMKRAYGAGPYREKFATWLKETRPLAESALTLTAKPKKAGGTKVTLNQLTLNLFGE